MGRIRTRYQTGSNNPTFAALMPIEDINVERDTGVTMRIAGIVTAYDTFTNLGIVTHRSASLLIDFSLMLQPLQADKIGKDQFVLVKPMTFQPPLKNTVECWGTLEIVQPEEIPITFLDRESVYEHRFLPSLRHVLRATLTRIVNDLNLDLWVRAARIQSAAIEQSTAEEVAARKADASYVACESRDKSHAYGSRTAEIQAEIEEEERLEKKRKREIEDRGRNRRQAWHQPGWTPWTTKDADPA